MRNFSITNSFSFPSALSFHLDRTRNMNALNLTSPPESYETCFVRFPSAGRRNRSRDFNQPWINYNAQRGRATRVFAFCSVLQYEPAVQIRSTVPRARFIVPRIHTRRNRLPRHRINHKNACTRILCVRRTLCARIGLRSVVRFLFFLFQSLYIYIYR